MEYIKILGFLGTTSGAVFLTHLLTKGKQNIEVQNLIGKTYLDMIEGMHAEIERLRERISELEAEVKQLKSTSGCKPKPFLRKV